MDVRGMLTIEALAALVQTGAIDTVSTVFPDLYGRLLGKQHDAEFFLDHVAGDGAHACDYLLTVDMEMDPVAGYGYASWEQGYGDVHLAPDLTTLRLASWRDRTALVICDVRAPDGGPVTVAPRSILNAQVAAGVSTGDEAQGASELEYHVVRATYQEAAAARYADLRRAGHYVEDYSTLRGSRDESFDAAARRHLRDSGIPVESSKGEAGVGQHELNIRYAAVGTMADRHVVYKHALKEIAAEQGLSVTFMAKPWQDGAGSSCHLHVSLWRDGQNVFASNGEGESDALRWFLGGWMAHAPELMVFYAPTVNSYKRYSADSWAPTSLSWGDDNRSAGFRLVGQRTQRRIECRIPGADCNPYLAYAAALASGLDGIAKQIEPPPPIRGSGYSEADSKLPGTLSEAVGRFAASVSMRVSSSTRAATAGDLLRDGRVLAGQVLERGSDGTLLLALGRARVLAQTRVPLDPGQRFLVRVVGDGDGALLRLLGHGDPGIEKLLTALRGVVGEERTLGQLLGDLAARIQAELARPGGTLSDLHTLLEALSRQGFDPGEGADALSTLLSRAGVRYEALLAAAVRRGIGPADLDRLRGNLKAELLGTLAKLEEGPVRELVTRLLSSLEAEQLLNVARRASSDPMLWTFPIPDAGGWTTARVTMPHREEARQGSSARGREEESLVVDVSLSRLGPVRAELALSRGRLALRLEVTNEEVADHLRSDSSQLVERLDAGQRVVQLSVRVVPTEELERRAQLLDVEFLRQHHLLDLEG